MKRKDIMLCYPFDRSRLSSYNGALVQPKLDGDRCRALWCPNSGTVTLLSSEGNVIGSVPHINQELYEILKHILTDVELDGELYIHGASHQSIRSIVGRTKNLHPRYHDIEYHVFDLINKDTQDKRIAFLNKHIMGRSEAVMVVQSVYIPEIDECNIGYLLNKAVSDGYEGICIRNAYGIYERKRSTHIMKLKPNKIDTYTVVGYQEEISIKGEPKDALGALILMSPEGEFNVGSGFTREQREELWRHRDRLFGRRCTIKYQEKTDGGIPRFPVFLYID